MVHKPPICPANISPACIDAVLETVAVLKRELIAHPIFNVEHAGGALLTPAQIAEINARIQKDCASMFDQVRQKTEQAFMIHEGDTAEDAKERLGFLETLGQFLTDLATFIANGVRIIMGASRQALQYMCKRIVEFFEKVANYLRGTGSANNGEPTDLEAGITCGESTCSLDDSDDIPSLIPADSPMPDCSVTLEFKAGPAPKASSVGLCACAQCKRR